MSESESNFPDRTSPVHPPAARQKPLHSIVLTGGPGAGKTVIAREIAARFSDRFVLVPEAATQVYAELQTRWDRLDTEGRCNVQRRIYQLQRQQEDQLRLSLDASSSGSQSGKILLLDRGTVDGSTYWPMGPAAYWDEIGSSLPDELNRYDAVIWLQTAAVLGIYDGDASNTCRFEDPPAAIASGNLLLSQWQKHPYLQTVAAYPKLEDKISAVEKILGEMLAARCPPL